MNRILVILLILPCIGLSQKETSQWCFGKYTGLNFNTNPPTVTSSSINTIEGCASIADLNGNLLFYTDGAKVWDQTHNIMANGTGLLGNGPYMTNQAAIIVKIPASSTQYLIFTLDDSGGPNGLMYHSVDLSLAAGLGSVTAKNIPLQSPSSERLSSVYHCNQTDVWILSHDLNNGTFRNYLVTAAGLSLTPVISNFTTGVSTYTGGAMKASPDGKHILMVTSTSSLLPSAGGFELYDFDNVTGVVSNRQILYNTHGAYSCEFSADSKKAYGTFNLSQTVPTSTAFGYLLQWDLCPGSQAQISASQYTLPGLYNKLALQLAKDSKIYIANGGQIYNSLSVLNAPQLAGVSSSLSECAISLTSGTIMAGLPNFNSGFFRQKNQAGMIVQGSSVPVCLSYDFTASACASDLADIVSANWSFGDLSSGALNTSTLTNPTHKFSAPGTYTVRVIKHYNCFSDTVLKVVQATAVSPILSVSGKTTVCVGNSTSLTVTGADTYSWSNGATTFSLLLNPNATTVYSVTGTYTASGCSSVKTVTVNVSPCLGLDETDNSNEVSVYPNPAGDYLIVQSTKVSKLEIYDALGRLVLQKDRIEGDFKLELQNLQNGVFLVKVIEFNGPQRLFRIIKN